uniref:Uncharacterized protein n=1 Tax=Populus trichocarpa TaxID=3694 RepID=A0A2K1XH53_POPTR
MTSAGCTHFFCLGICAPNLKTGFLKPQNLHLSAAIRFEKIEEISCALCLIRSSPDLQKLAIRAKTKANAVMEPVLEYMRVQNFLDCSLNRLREVEMQLIYGVQQELEFIKFLLAKSTIYFC